MAQNAGIKEAAMRVSATIESMENGQEYYIILERGEDRRIAVIAAKQDGKVELTLEVQARLVSSAKGRELDGMSAGAAMVSALLAGGYAPGDQEEAWACAEKRVSVLALNDEIEAIIGLAGGH